jgi:hypothetical protein
MTAEAKGRTTLIMNHTIDMDGYSPLARNEDDH